MLLREPCPGSSPRRLTPRIGQARKALWTPHLQTPLSELGDSPARPSLLGRLTRRRRKPAVGNTVFRPGHAKLLWAVDPGQTRCRPDTRDSPGAPAAPSRSKLTSRRAVRARRRARASAAARARLCVVIPLIGFYRILPRGSFLRGFFPLAV